jgi:hypothetical protein
MYSSVYDNNHTTSSRQSTKKIKTNGVCNKKILCALTFIIVMIMLSIMIGVFLVNYFINATPYVIEIDNTKNVKLNNTIPVSFNNIYAENYKNGAREDIYEYTDEYNYEYIQTNKHFEATTVNNNETSTEDYKNDLYEDYPDDIDEPIQTNKHFETTTVINNKPSTENYKKHKIVSGDKNNVNISNKKTTKTLYYITYDETQNVYKNMSINYIDYSNNTDKNEKLNTVYDDDFNTTVFNNNINWNNAWDGYNITKSTAQIQWMHENFTKILCINKKNLYSNLGLFSVFSYQIIKCKKNNHNANILKIKCKYYESVVIENIMIKNQKLGTLNTCYCSSFTVNCSIDNFSKYNLTLPVFPVKFQNDIDNFIVSNIIIP